MRLLARIDDRPLELRAPERERVSRGDDPHQVRDASSGREIPRGAGGVADELSHPLDEHVLHPNRAGSGEEHPGEAVAHRREVVGERRRVETAPRDVAEVSRGGRVQPGAIHVACDMREELVERAGLLPEGRLVEPGAVVLGLDEGGPLGKRLEEGLGIGRHVPQQSLARGAVGLQGAARRLQLADRSDERHPPRLAANSTVS